MPVLPPGQSSPSQSGQPGNTAVPTPATAGSGIQNVPFPMLVLATIVVAGGIWVVDQIDSRAAWGLALLVLLVVAFGYPSFGQELYKLLGGTKTSTDLGSAGSVGSGSSTNGLVGPTGAIG